jgi:hypothetical protein
VKLKTILSLAALLVIAAAAVAQSGATFMPAGEMK